MRQNRPSTMNVYAQDALQVAPMKMMVTQSERCLIHWWYSYLNLWTPVLMWLAFLMLKH
jgi:hypothetical protein